MEAHEPPAIDGPAAERLRQLIMGFRTTALIHVAAKLGLADHLERESKTARQLAEEVGAEPRALHRLLRALASLGIFTETEDGAFALTPLAELLRTRTAGSLRSLAVLYGEEWLGRAYGGMLHSVQTGRPAFDHVHGRSFYDYLKENPAAAAQFHSAMSGYSDHEAAAILDAYDFSPFQKVVDVGGGHGTLVAALLRAYPLLSGVLFDLPSVAEGAERLLVGSGVKARVECRAGDFLKTSLPSQGDVYLLKSVLHNWEDHEAVRILRACREAMAPEARLLVIERIVPPGNEPAEAKLFDINMLVVAGGRERTESEYRVLLRDAGFALARIIATRSAVSLLEGVVPA